MYLLSLFIRGFSLKEKKKKTKINRISRESIVGFFMVVSLIEDRGKRQFLQIKGRQKFHLHQLHDKFFMYIQMMVFGRLQSVNIDCYLLIKLA